MLRESGVDRRYLVVGLREAVELEKKGRVVSSGLLYFET